MNRTITSEDIFLGTWGEALKLSRRSSGVAVLTINVKGATNTLSSFVLDCFTEAIQKVEEDKKIKALILHSEKPDIFITGADIREIARLETEQEAKDLSCRGHGFLKKALALKIPTVAAIEGVCLGGGLELAICLDRRIASNSKSTMLGLPELTIGLIPGLGGTQRLPRLIGYRPSVDLILSSSTIDSNKALELGLVDQVVNPEELLSVAENTALELVKTGFVREVDRERRETRVEERDGGKAKRASVVKLSQRAVRMRAGSHYPAPPLAIESIKVGLEEGLEKGLAFEIEAFAKVAASSTAKNMIQVYYNKEMASQIALRAAKAFKPPETVAIIGSGFMGKGIAELVIDTGINVFIKGSSDKKSEQEVNRLKKKYENKHSGSITALTDINCLSNCDLVIESVNENLEIKQAITREISPYLADTTVFCSNTSSIPVGSMAKCSDKSANFIGLHFFNPIGLMPLVEVISHPTTSKEAYNRALAFVGRLGKVPISVKDSPGFVVNRLLTCYITESLRMACYGIPVNWIENMAKGYGMPLGPFELLDELGWSLSRAVSECQADCFGERLKLPDLMYLAIEKGFEGKQNNQGCYLWEDGARKLSFNPVFLDCLKAKTAEEAPTGEELSEIEERLFLNMVDEAARCLEEKVVKKPRDIDLALIIGAGYPPFRGGLLRSADKLGIDQVITKLEKIYTDYKPKREVSNLLHEMDNIGRKFYSLN